MLTYEEVEKAITSNDAVQLADIIKRYNLKFDGNKIVAQSQDVEEAANFWDRRQLIKKILLNS